MQISRQDIATAAMVSVGKVNKDIQRGKLDDTRLIKVAMYIVGNRMLAGEPSDITGLVPMGLDSDETEEQHKSNESQPASELHYEPCDDYGA
jgi:hypothetical protein